MIIINTTFHVHHSVEADFLQWLRSEYVVSATGDGGLVRPVLSRVMAETDPGSTGYALQMQAESMEEASGWYDGKASVLRVRMWDRWGERVLFFTTYLEVVDCGHDS